jgi:hypothetical protein
MNTQVVLTPPPTPSPSQALSGVLTGSPLYTTFLELLRPWIKRVVNDPRVAEGVAQELLGNTEFLYLLTMLSQDMVLRVSEDELRNAYKVLHTKFREFDIDIEDSIEIVVEHDLWKLRQIKENFSSFTSMYIDFTTKNPGDVYRYVTILVALTILLITSIEVRSHEKLELLASEIKRFADELELYTLTFMLALEKDKEENKVITTARNLEELKMVLGVE